MTPLPGKQEYTAHVSNKKGSAGTRTVPAIYPAVLSASQQYIADRFHFSTDPVLFYCLHFAAKFPFSTSIRMVSPAPTSSERINFAESVSTVFWRYRFKGLAPYTGS